jgi:D-beta-D-heptose 7-phosphate kinase/D-beta-D-heptose 1-phosphate adenosyltransferase
MTISVFGDVMLDEYVRGTTTRMCPEAPVPIVKNPTVERAAGGAANVASNVASLLELPVNLYGSTGDDLESEYLKEILLSKNVTPLFTKFDSAKTTVKRRILSGDQYITRIDIETPLEAVSYQPDNADIIIISDYNKGSVSNANELIRLFNGAPVLVDPKNTFDNYYGAYLVKPNEKEFREYVCDYSSKEELIKAARENIIKNDIANMLITLGSNGMILVNRKECVEFPAENVEVYDVTGAGDVVIATIAYGLYSGKSLKSSIELSINAASIAVSKPGTYVVTKSDLKNKGQRLVFTNGCFDIIHPGHISLLQKAKSLGDKLIVGLNSDDSIRRIKREPTNSQEARKAVLSAIGCVDEVIIFDDDTPYDLIKKLHPDVLVKGGDYTVDNVVGCDLVNEVVIIPTLDTYSTTSIMEKIKNDKT